MKYGKLTSAEGIDLRLPADHAATAAVLPDTPAATDVRLGGTMWNIPQWVGTWYPERTKQREYLHAYGKLFTTIELNATHYRTPSVDTVRGWALQVPDDFLFCPKFPQSISHYRRFNDCAQQTDEFLLAIHAFGKKLGPAFIQLSDRYAPTKVDDVLRYLEALPRDMQFAIEFRHPDWFSDHPAVQAVWDLATERGIIAVISDTLGRRDAIHMRLTTPHCIVRFGGMDKDPTDEVRLAQWADRVAAWSQRGLRSFHLWMHQPDSVHSPETCALFADQVAERTGWAVRKPQQQFSDRLF